MKLFSSWLPTALALALAPCTAAASALANGDLESGMTQPADWVLANAGGGTFEWTDGDGRGGTRGARLGSATNGYALLYQEVDAQPGMALSFEGWTKLASGTGSGELKLEFRDAQGQRVAEHVRPLRAPVAWERFSIVGLAPAGSVRARAVIVGTSEGVLDFDDLTLAARDPADAPRFDLAELRQTFTGFGTQVWAHPATAEYPDLEAIRAQALADYAIRYARVENFYEATSWDDVRALRAITDTLGIDWVYVVWAAPGSLQTDTGLLSDVGAFARWWARHTATAHANGVPVEYVELMNEPDSAGQWSTGISHAQYARLVPQTRRLLDRLGLRQVGIVGPGTSSTSWSGPDLYINALDSQGVAALAAWSTHTWADDFAGAYPQGPVATAGQWPSFAAHAHARAPDKPRLVTEYASKLDTFANVSYRPADASPWDDTLVFPYHNVTNSQPYAAHVFANTLALLNAQHGAEGLLVWQLIDEPTEVLHKGKGWGMIDLWGNPKPVAGAVRTLTDALRPGARVVAAPDQAYSPVYAGVFVQDTQVLVAMANTTEAEAVAHLRLDNAAPALSLQSALMHQRITTGDPVRGEPDESITSSVDVSLSPGEAPGSYVLTRALPPFATLTVTLTPGT